jgi:outer membrane receptor protein involved in Fe transport
MARPYLVAAASIALASVVDLQVAPSASAVAAGTEEIVVTVRRKEESLQEVPMAVTAISLDEIEKRGIKNLVGITSLDPSVVIDQGFSAEDTRIAIRGITNTRGRSNVAFLVDGVDVTSESVSTAGSSLLVSQRLLTDVERIEIIKGPQSALYGRSAFAGAISYVTRNANLEELDANAEVDISEYNRYQVSAGVSGPVIKNKLGLRLQAVNWDGDSYYDNEATGRNLGSNKGWAAALTTTFEPVEEFRLKWRLSYNDSEAAAQPQFTYSGDDLTSLPIPAEALQSNGGPLRDSTVVNSAKSFGNAKGRQVLYSENPLTGEEYLGSSLELFRTSLQFDWDVGRGTFTSITGYTDADTNIQQDLDYQGLGLPDTIANGWALDSINGTKQFSQEIRYATAFDGPVNLTGGLLGWTETRTQSSRGYIAVCGFYQDPNGPDRNEPCRSGNWQDLVRQTDIQYGQDGFTDATTDHWSIYGLVDWSMTELLTLSFEARYVNENFDLDRSLGTPCLLSPGRGCSDIDSVSGTVRSDFVVPKATLDYAFRDNINLYIAVGKGQKPGGISTLNSGGVVDIESLSFAPEILWNSELGWKTSFDGDFGRLVFNGALFYQDYSDKQVVVQSRAEILNPNPPPEFITTTVQSVENASSAAILGQEIQLVYIPPVDGLSINFAYTHLDTEYTNFLVTTASEVTIAELGQCTQVLDVDKVKCQVDFSGNALERSPEHSVASTISLIRPLFASSFDYLAELDVNYQSSRYVGPTNYSELEPYWLLNLRLGVQAENWSVIAYANNLLDNDAIVSGGSAAPDFGAGFKIPPTIQSSSQLPVPQVIGIRANYSY